MIDIANVQLYGFPVLIYAMILVTTGAITYATVYSDQLPAVGPLPVFPSANPSSSNTIPGMPAMGAPPPIAPSSSSLPTSGQQGGKHNSKTKRHRSSKKSHYRSRSTKHVKKHA